MAETIELKKPLKVKRKLVVKVKKKRAYTPKRKKAVVSPDRIFNIDVLHYWATGERRMVDENEFELVSEGNVLHYEGNGHVQIAYQDPNGKILVNGDERTWDDDIEAAVDRLQKVINSNTTSFRCFEMAGIKLDDILVLDSQSDLSEVIKKKDKRFKDAHKNVPKGATLTNHRNYTKKTGKYSGSIWMKKIHRAGAILVKANDKTYIASMDETQYYIIELSKPAKTLAQAFNALKPARVRTWEKKNGKLAERQGEWYFIPAPKGIEFSDNVMCDEPLPMKSSDSNAHDCEEYEVIKKRNYVGGNIDHDQHNTVTLSKIHEAIENTAVNAWSIEGVD